MCSSRHCRSMLVPELSECSSRQLHLGQEGDRPTGVGLGRKLVAVHGRDQHDPDLWVDGVDSSRNLDAALVTESDIDQDEIRPGTTGDDCTTAFLPIGCGTEEGELLVGVHHLGRNGSKGLLIIDDQYGDRLHIARGWAHGTPFQRGTLILRLGASGHQAGVTWSAGVPAPVAPSARAPLPTASRVGSRVNGMATAAHEIEIEATAGVDARSSLLPFIDLDRLGALAGIATVIVANSIFFRIAAVWLILPFLAALVGALTLARRAALDQRPTTALTWITAGNWTVACVVALLFPFLWPLMIMTVLMPLVLAAPLLPPVQIRPAVVATALTASVVASIGLLNDDGGAAPDLDDDLELVFVVGGLAVHTVPIGAVIAHSNRLQTRSIRRAAELNQRLLISQDDLAHSRRRIVEAENAERRRIERDLHDGAQQRLVALALRLRLLENRLPRDSPIRGNVEQLVVELDGAVEELRELAHGIYPPVLQARGLAEALHSVGRRSAGVVQVEADEVGRMDDALETALYYVALEAVANAMKHAPGALIEVRLQLESGSVTLRVTDGGPGFDLNDVARSTGLLNMLDRISAVGGSLDIESKPGATTTVTAMAPIGEPHPTQV